MIVSLIGKGKMYKLKLPRIINGNYWIADETGRKLLLIDGQDNRWKIYSDNNINIFDNNKNIINSINLKEYDSQIIFIKKLNEMFILYCSPIFDENFTPLEIKNKTEISIGRNKNNTISYNNIFVSDLQATISYNNGRAILENYDKKFGTFVNNSPVYKNKRVLLNGDIIYIMGLKIIIIGNTIFINNPLDKVKYDENMFELIQEKFDIPNFCYDEEIDDEENDIEKKYYSRAPRIRNKIEHEEIKIDPPPPKESNREMPAILLYGSSFAMSFTMLASMISSLNSIKSGESNVGPIIQFIGSLLMLITMLFFPMLEKKWEKKQRIKHEKKRQERYRKYIKSKITEIDEIMKKQKDTLFENYVSIEECSNIIISKSSRLWERKTEEFDFLTLRLGIGNVPLDIDIQYPEKQFEMEDDDLVDILNEVAHKSKVLKNVPILLSLTEKNIVGVVSKDEEERKRYIKNLIIQLITFQSYEDLKLVFLLKKDNNKSWEHLNLLPYVWSNTKDIRFFTDNYDEMKEISKYLEQEFNNRKKHNGDIDFKQFKPYYLIITDDYQKIQNLKIIEDIQKSKTNMGFGMICMSNEIVNLPNESKSFIELESGYGNVFESEMTKEGKKEFKYDKNQRIFWLKISETLANIPIRFNASKEMNLPNTYTFLEMYDVGTIEQLNILERWRKNDSTRSLSALIGIDPSGMPIALDVHEKFHGPHGLIAGTTGSGKSEFIITYVLSLAINYHPDDVTFILIDYKGGGLAGAFSKRGIKLPHLVGTITNIDKAGLQRSLASIQSELRRRQIMFNEARNMTDEGTIDIYKYQRLYHDGKIDKPISHLFIICDEFAELKQQQEEFMDELISVARIGRSLGVHLILATQKPSGVVNDQIRSNAKFAVCLKVQDTGDSTDLIRRPDAAYLKNAGRFYLQVGNDEYFVLGQSAWSGAQYYPATTTKKKTDNAIDFISDIGVITKSVDDSNNKMNIAKGEQLTNIITYLDKLAKMEGIKKEQLWLENIPETIYIKDIKNKYKFKSKENEIISVIGEFDDPNNQRQGIVKLNIKKDGNVVIYGNAESGKETLLSTIIYDIMTTYETSKIQMYILDCGSGASKIFKNSPSVGDVILMDEDEKIARFFDMIQSEIKTRKAILAEYNGDYELFLQMSGKSMPMMLIIINAYEAFSENTDDNYDDIFISITREGLKCGIVFLITASASNDVRYRLTQNFGKKIALQLNNEDDYWAIFDKVGKKRPPHIFGRGLVEVDENGVYEFQTAKICEPERWNIFIKEEISNLIKINQEPAKPIPVMPDTITIADLKSEIIDLTKIPLGMEKNTLKIYSYDFKKNFITLITGKTLDNMINFSINLIEEIKTLKDIDIIILDAERAVQTRKFDLTNNHNSFITKLDNSFDKKDTIVFIIGIEKYINELESEENDFLELLQKAERKGNYNFVIIDNVSKIKNREYDDWYKNYIQEGYGIWVGNGVDDQYLINTNNDRKTIVNNCGASFGYVIKQEIPTMIKLLGIKEKDVDYE